MAKLYCSEIAKEVADEAVQIHGGYGLMKDYPIERFYRDQRLLQIGGGTSEKVSFEVYVVDRSGNQSNFIETDEITINQ